MGPLASELSAGFDWRRLTERLVDPRGLQQLELPTGGESACGCIAAEGERAEHHAVRACAARNLNVVFLVAEVRAFGKCTFGDGFGSGTRW